MDIFEFCTMYNLDKIDRILAPVFSFSSTAMNVCMIIGMAKEIQFD